MPQSSMDCDVPTCVSRLSISVSTRDIKKLATLETPERVADDFVLRISRPSI